MGQKEIYIVQSAHLTSEFEDGDILKKIQRRLTDTEAKFIQKAARVQYQAAKEIMKEIIRRRWVDSLFFDSIPERIARLAYRVTIEPKLIEELAALNGAKGIPIIEYLRLVKEGHDLYGAICAFETEKEDKTTENIVEFSDAVIPKIEWGLETGLIDERSEELLAMRREEKGNKRSKKSRKAYQDAVMQAYLYVRDKDVFNNVSTVAGDQSILFMGSMHELRDFYETDSGFQVTNIRVYQESFDNLLKYGRIHGSNELKYKIRIANRESVRQGIQEIVERSIERYNQRE